jgi:putative methionine-R-sulfoxide reductase with GAF domain
VATSRREYIFQNIAETLATMRVENGYEYTVDEENIVLIHGKKDDSAYAEPVIFVYPSRETTNFEKGEKGKDYNELEIQIEAYIRGTRDTMNANINKMLADLKKALGADHTRGGYAIDTQFLSNDAFLTDLTGEKCGIVLIIQVDYEHAYGDPYNL